MRAIQVAFMIIIINISLSFVSHAQIFGEENRISYEGEYIPQDMEVEIIQQEVEGLSGFLIKAVGGIYKAVDYFGIMISSLSFNWVYLLVPAVMASNSLLIFIVFSMNLILGLLIAVAVIEFVMKRFGVLG